ncbi:MAG TPA: 50S ribosomal protein L23 [Saprospiraceae bacterium]|nr:50S ribosomal protein L23 [Saprospiraceae bacterium]
MAKRIIIKPIISEKGEILSEEMNKYTFQVDKKANKQEIKESIEDLFDVKVKKVHTLILPGKRKIRNTRSGLQRSRIPSYKKAIVTLHSGEEIDFFGDI